jgi:hypothetical protein
LRGKGWLEVVPAVKGEIGCRGWGKTAK